MNNLKIGILVNNIENSGPVRGAVALFEGMNDLGADVSLFSLGNENKEKLNFMDDVDVFYINTNFFNFFFKYFSFKKELKKRNINVVISYGFRSVFLSSLLPSIFLKSAVVMASSIKEAIFFNYKNKVKAFSISLLSYLFLGFQDIVIYAREEMIIKERSNYLLKPKNFAILPINPINEKKIFKMSQDFSIIEDYILKLLENKNNLNLITASHLIKRKNITEIITSLALLKKEGVDNINFFVIGNGDQKRALEDLSKDLNLENNIFFLGYKENPLPYVKLSDCFIMSSFSEGFPVAAMEALCLGVPVILPDLVGFRDVLEERTGIVYKKGDLKNAIFYFYQNKKDFQGKLSIQLSREYTAKMYLDLLKNNLKK
jgi:glycosyltransferase involved in cell wall biosynthesis